VTADPKELSKIFERFETVGCLRGPKGGWICADRVTLIAASPDERATEHLSQETVPNQLCLL